MDVDPRALLTILLMALATYATRAGGLWIASRFDLSDRMETWLGYIPGAILVSLVAPVVFTSGPAEALVAVAVMLAAALTRSLPTAMVVGVDAVVALRSLEAMI